MSQKNMWLFSITVYHDIVLFVCYAACGTGYVTFVMYEFKN